ncbi:MAG: protein TolQ, partial [Gammaproteobacteria bacterium]
MTADLSLLELVLNASVLVQLVMLLLLVASLMSWTMIFRKLTTLRRARAAADDFEEQFWSGQDLV